MPILIFICALLINTTVNASEQLIYATKVKYEEESYFLKLAKESELVNLLGRKEPLKTKMQDSSCVSWVYQGSASREESVRACQGVRDMDCVRWVYQGSASREESARTCRGVVNMECVRFVYEGPSSREESVRACEGVRDMQCVRFLYQGPSSREQAARSCGSNGSGGGRHDRC
jgi:bacterioferritin-associated ferredoxin